MPTTESIRPEFSGFSQPVDTVAPSPTTLTGKGMGTLHVVQASWSSSPAFSCSIDVLANYCRLLDKAAKSTSLLRFRNLSSRRFLCDCDTGLRSITALLRGLEHRFALGFHQLSVGARAVPILDPGKFKRFGDKALVSACGSACRKSLHKPRDRPGHVGICV
jgi:hypothetical protein